MPYSVVDDDTSLQVRASIAYDDRTEELLSLILLLQDRLLKIQKAQNADRPADAVQPRSLPAGDTGDNNGNPEAEAKDRETPKAN